MFFIIQKELGSKVLSYQCLCHFPSFLSSFKVCFSAFTFFYAIDINDNVVALYIESNVKFFDCYKQPYFIPYILLLLSFVIVPVFLPCLYPTKCCKIACRRISSARQQNAVFLFMDAFQGHYKDGTGGTYDYRSASCIGFVIRFIACTAFIAVSAGRSLLISLVLPILLAISLFYAYVQPCKKRHINLIESLLYITATSHYFYEQLLHTPPLNTMNYLHEVMEFYYTLTQNQWRKKIMMKKGKK